jgi:site-specific recombinase XerD
MKLKTIRKSHKKEKKFDAVFEKNGKEKVVPFGQKGYSDFTKHKDKTRKQRYLKRHSGMGEHWEKPDTPGALSKWILWNKPSFDASVASFKKHFGL